MCCEVMDCHVLGMLNRDLRTIVTIDRRRSDSQDVLAGEDVDSIRDLHQCSCTSRWNLTRVARCVRHPCDRRTRKSNQRWSSRVAQRFKEVLVVGVYLLSIIHIPLSCSAPTNRQLAVGQDMEGRMSSHPKWINPCGMGASDDPLPHDIEPMVVSDYDLLNQIVVQAKIALGETDHFKNDYVQQTFNMDFKQHHTNWYTNRYDWLPEIPKHLGDRTPDSHLRTLQLDSSLLDTFEYLQKIAVGLEQVVWDQEDESGPFHDRFKNAEFKLRALLCEIQVAIIERGLSTRDDVRRDIMTEEYRQMNNSSHRNLRDWLIFRDYMNALEYVIDVFENFKSNL